MSDMKLIMENWRRFSENQEIQEEGLKDILKKGAAGLALAGTLAGASPAMAQSPDKGQEKTISVKNEDKDLKTALRGYLANFMDKQDTKLNQYAQDALIALDKNLNHPAHEPLIQQIKKLKSENPEQYQKLLKVGSGNITAYSHK